MTWDERFRAIQQMAMPIFVDEDFGSCPGFTIRIETRVLHLLRIDIAQAIDAIKHAGAVNALYDYAKKEKDTHADALAVCRALLGENGYIDLHEVIAMAKDVVARSEVAT